MKLYYTPTSPFVRKVMIAAHETALIGQIETVFLRPTPTKADAGLSKDNPLSKIPVLVTQDGEAIYDSAVIVDYLDTLHEGHLLIPRNGLDRVRALRRQALADGILEACVLVFYERSMRPKELHWESWIQGQTEKAKQGLDQLEQEADSFPTEIDVGQITIAAAIGWLEFRNVLGDLRATRPRLFAWYDKIRERPSMKATEPHA
jgi:glutathione S-transferase